MWKNTDPRLETNVSANIIIVRPSINHILTLDVCSAYVYEEGWRIFTEFEGHKNMGADEVWDELWFWIPAPNIKQNNILL